MITIIHGDDIVSSRKYLIEEKQKHKDSLSILEEDINITNLTQIFEGERLFFDSKVLFIEDFFTKAGKSKDIVNYVKKSSKNVSIYFWEGSILTKSSLSLFQDPLVKTFKIPQNLFIFLDGLKPKNSQALIRLFHGCLANSEVELVFYMIIRQFRLILALKEPSQEQIDEVKRLAPWQKSKLQRQASLFSSQELLTIYKKLFEIDLSVKTGALPFPLTAAVDFFLVDI